MSSHRAHRITEGSSVLNPESFNGIRIVTAPDLRRIVKHSGVKSSAAPAAAFNQHIRISSGQTLQKIIESQDVAVHDLSLTLCRQYGTVYITDVPVEIPFQIFHLSMIQHLAHLIKYMVSYIFSGKIQYKLIPSPHWLFSRNGKYPVRMLPVKITVLGNAFRLKPDTEFQSQSMYFFGKLTQSTAKLFLIHVPVSQAAVVIVPFSKPAIIQNEKLHSHICRICCHLKKLFSGKGKVGAFPVIQKNGASCIFIFSSADVVTYSFMERMCHSFKALAAVHHGSLRRPEILSRFQKIPEIIRMDSHHKAGLFHLVMLCLCQEISTVKERNTVAFPICFAGLLICKDYKRIVVMAGRASYAANRLYAVMNRHTGELTFHFVPSVKSKKIKISIRKIKTGAHHPLQINVLFGSVFHTDSPGDHIQVLHNAIIQVYIQFFPGVL